jgi:hypothetical protein
MVENRITDGKRIAQLLASELTGLEQPPLDRIEVVDATPDVEPTPEGVEAYGVALDGDRIGTVTAYPESVMLTLDGSISGTGTVEGGDGVTVTADGDGVTIEIEYGAAVKRAVDVLVAVVSA